MKKRYYILAGLVLFAYVAGFRLDFNKDTYVTLYALGSKINLTNGRGNVNFTDEYIKNNKGKYRVEIPEVHELVNIMIAISEVGQADSNMINNRSSYHKDVLEHFLPFATHPVINVINQQITLGYNDHNSKNKDEIMKSYRFYYAWKMNACGYLFDENGSIVDDGIIRRMGSGNPVKKNLKLIEDFVLQTGFRDFYKSNKSYYDSLLVAYKELNPINEMKSWLEKQFETQYGSYRITFSPLVGGSHATKRYSDNGFTQAVMFVSKATYRNGYNRALNELVASRVVFTEIGHHFVNPISDTYSSEINKAFGNRSLWVNSSNLGVGGYKTPYKVFNEYMTWATYSLYAYDNYNVDDLDIFINKMEFQMENERGFIKFKAFNQKLLSMYKSKSKNKKVFELYSELLNWCSEQNNNSEI